LNQKYPTEIQFLLATTTPQRIQQKNLLMKSYALISNYADRKLKNGLMMIQIHLVSEDLIVLGITMMLTKMEKLMLLV
jgi:hypothetical protein